MEIPVRARRSNVAALCVLLPFGRRPRRGVAVLTAMTALSLLLLLIFGVYVAQAQPSINCVASNPGASGLLDVSVSGTSSASDSLTVVASGGDYSLTLVSGGSPSPVYTTTTYPDSGSSGYPTVEVTGTTLLSTDFEAVDPGVTFIGQAGVANVLGLSQVSTSSSVPLSVNVSGGPYSGGQANDTAVAGSAVYSFSGVSSFVGSGSGNTTFAAGTAGGYTFSGSGSGNVLDVGAAGSGVPVSVPNGTVSVGGGSDVFSGIQTFDGPAAGGATFTAGPAGGYTFNGDGSGNTFDLSSAPAGTEVIVNGDSIADPGTVTHLTSGIDRFADIQFFNGSVTIESAVGALPPSLSAATAGVGYSVQLTGSGGSQPYGAWSIQNGALPPGVSLSASGLLSGTPTTPGTYSFVASLLDAQGVPGATAYTLTVNLATSPTSVSSTTVNGSYGVGAVLPVTVAFSKPVTVTGTPQLSLNSNGTAYYSSGSGTNTLTFTYTVAPGQNAHPLDEASTSALTLNGGTIKDTASNAASLTLPAPGAAGSLAADKDIVIDTSRTMATCTLTPRSSKVAVQRLMRRRRPKTNPATLTLIAQCNQNANATLRGALTEYIRPKPKHGKQRTKQVNLVTLHTSLKARDAKLLIMKVPAAVVLALKDRLSTTGAFTLTVTNDNGTVRATATILALKL